MKTTTYIGVDLAERMGVAIYFPFINKVHVNEFKGNPIEQLEFIQGSVNLLTNPAVCLELMHHFQNAVTSRNIYGRYGYIKWSLVKEGIQVREVSHQVARSFLGCKNKEQVLKKFEMFYTGDKRLTDNHTDAIAVAMYAGWLDGIRNDDLPVVEIGVFNVE